MQFLVKDCWIVSMVWAGVLLNRPSWSGQMRWNSLQKYFTEAQHSLSQQYQVVQWYRRVPRTLTYWGKPVLQGAHSPEHNSSFGGSPLEYSPMCLVFPNTLILITKKSSAWQKASERTSLSSRRRTAPPKRQMLLAVSTVSSRNSLCTLTGQTLSLRFYLFTFLERQEGREKKRETLTGCLSYMPWLETQPTTQVSALTRLWPFGLQNDTQPTEPHRSVITLRSSDEGLEARGN